jgi:peptidoglycan/LPS O-acetylase OafA/YrhL
LNKTFPGLDVLRVLLSFYLVLFHTLPSYLEYSPTSLGGILGFGGFATSTFFILSGFILTHIYIGANPAHGMRVPASRFFINRLSSLYPIHIVTLLMTVVLVLMSSHPADTFLQTAAPQTKMADEAVRNLFMQLLLLQAWDPSYLSYNIPAWSLSTLMLFYLVFPVLGPRLMRMSNKWTMLLLVWAVYLAFALVAVNGGWFGKGTIGVFHTNPLVRLPEFLAGVLAYGIYAEHTETINRTVRRHGHALLALLAIVFCVASYLFTHGPIARQVLLHNGAMLPFQAALVIVCACTMSNVSSRAGVVMRRLGNASLSIFALQSPLFMLYSKAEKIMSLPFPLFSCVHRFHLCAHVAGGIPLRLSFYPIFLLLIAMTAVPFQEKAVAPMRTWLRGVLKREAMPSVLVHPAISSD